MSQFNSKEFNRKADELSSFYKNATAAMKRGGMVSGDKKNVPFPKEERKKITYPTKKFLQAKARLDALDNKK